MVKKRPHSASVKRRVRHHDDNYRKQLAKRVREVREARGYSIDRLSLESEHLSRATISRIESGKTDPQISTLKRIAEVLGVSINELLDFSDITR